MPSNLLSKNEKSLGPVRNAAAILFLWEVLFDIVAVVTRTSTISNAFIWWASILSTAALVVLCFIGKKNIWLLVPLAIKLLISFVNIFARFRVPTLLNLVGYACLCFIVAAAIIPHVSKKIENLPKAVVYVPVAFFAISTSYVFIECLVRRFSFSFSFLLFLNESISVASYFFFVIALANGMDAKDSTSTQNASSPTPAQAVPAPPPPIQMQKPEPGVLLVRFSIDKLNELSGSYGFQSGKLIGRAVPPSLLEGMTISDGDSAATLAGREYVCVVSIASSDISLLKEKIEPLILASEEIRACGAAPLTEIVPNTREPLVIDGVVRNGKIEGAGGWCASGFMNAWKEAMEAPVQEVKSEASAVAALAQGENEEKPMSASEIANLVDKLAHFSTFGMDRSEEEKMGAELLKNGDAALKAIVNYLILCASGRQSNYWWSNASYLVKMIKEFPNADLEQIYNTLINQGTNIWEYHTQIKDVAEQELLNLKKASPDYDKSVIPDVDARAELNALFNSGGSVESRLERAISMRTSSEAWSNENKAYYYYILGYYVQHLSSDDTKALPFYAAQVFYRPDRTSGGWDKIQSISAFKDISRTQETAELLHEMFPIPENWDYLLSLK